MREEANEAVGHAQPYTLEHQPDPSSCSAGGGGAATLQSIALAPRPRHLAELSQRLPSFHLLVHPSMKWVCSHRAIAESAATKEVRLRPRRLFNRHCAIGRRFLSATCHWRQCSGAQERLKLFANKRWLVRSHQVVGGHMNEQGQSGERWPIQCWWRQACELPAKYR